MNDNDPRTAEQKADPTHWRVGDVIMLHPEAQTADRVAHPHAGRLGKIVSILPARPANLLTVALETAAAAGTDTYVVLPAGMFLGVPRFCTETYASRPGYSAWRLTAEGRRILAEIDWPLTPASLGGRLARA